MPKNETAPEKSFTQSSTQRTLNMLRDEWQREEWERLAALIESDLTLWDGTGNPEDVGYMHAIYDVLRLLRKDTHSTNA
jgi:hypothetical protein